MHISNRIKKLRQSSSITRKELATGIVSYSHYCNIESGNFLPNNDILRALAKKLKVAEEYLVRYKEDDEQLQDLLMQLLNKINDLEFEEADVLLLKIKEKYPLINSIYQEIMFYLLESYYCYRSRQISEGLRKFKEDVFPLMEENDVDKLPHDFEVIYYYMLAIVEFHKENYYISYEKFLRSLSLVNNNVLKGSINYNIALIFYKLHNIHKAIPYAVTALNIYLHEHQWQKVSDVYNLLGGLYYENKELIKAEENFLKALDIAKMQEMNDITERILNNLGMVYKAQGKINQSLDYFFKSIALKKENNHNPYIAYHSILEIYLEQDLFEDLMMTLEEAREYCESERDLYRLKMIEAKMNFKMQNYQVYEDYLQESISYFYEQNLWKYMDKIVEELGDYYHELRKYKIAAKYYKIALEVAKKWSLNN
ncbi:hypothetical protein BHF71_08890 [Vulcanibacillus modesticaldus]|uniref:HTH cro/C1-type domain-containing protein n=1 Tax=Vulcanibacillus modesticaldus TaxID=337097 RepID=A0A1D2YUU6_9BACI|nr:helix-turn-helix transcriptional regulator [Vulcanibacillus modesticaldus]OEF99469.1 hypothetical protein BHF71_08890 [Vulcanibacillus modesticaldus]